MHLVFLKCDIVNYTVTDNKQKKRRTIKQENDVIVKKKQQQQLEWYFPFGHTTLYT